MGNGADFSYEQFGPFDHDENNQSGANDTIQLSFGYTLKDTGGKKNQGSLFEEG